MEQNSPAHLARRILIGRIETLTIGQTDAALSFEGRLAAENGWTGSFAGRVATEYRRFLGLVAISDEQLTPSDAVDQAWHLHMAYTRNYWHGLCRDIVARDIHHEPTSGGLEQREHYRDRYARTLNLYRDTFGAAPPADVWPDPSERFSGNFQRVDRTRKMLLGAEEATLVGFTSAGLTVLIVEGLVALVAALLLGAAIVTWIQALRLKAGKARRRFDLSFNGGACGSGGCGCGDGGCGGGCGGGAHDPPPSCTNPIVFLSTEGQSARNFPSFRLPDSLQSSSSSRNRALTVEATSILSNEAESSPKHEFL